MGKEVVPDEIHAAARSITSAATGVRRHDPSEHLASVSTCLPGSHSASAAALLKSTWDTRNRVLTRDLDSQATSLHGSANNWTEADADSCTWIGTYRDALTGGEQ